MRELVDEGGERLLQRELHRVGVNDVDAVDVGEENVALQAVLLIHHALVVDLDRFGRKVLAVLELHALPELHRIDEAVGARFIAFGEHVHELHVLVEREEPFVEGLHDRLRERVARVVGVERREGGGDRNGHVLLGGLSSARGKEGAGKEKGQSSLDEFHLIAFPEN